MKKLLSVSPSKILIFCGLGLLMTLGSFWHLQTNQVQLERMSVLNQGVGTCFNRISQTFTAMMIKDVHSSYLNRGFMSLSDECLSETVKGISPFKQSIGKGFQTLTKLVSDVHWFHETVTRTHTPMVAGKNLNASLSPISEKFGQMESLKVSLMDEIDATTARIRAVGANDQVLIGMGLMIFVMGLSLLALQEFNRMQMQKEIEAESLNLLRAGQANVSSMVDRIVDRALVTQRLPVTAQIFRDYHGDVVERLAMKGHMPVAPAVTKNDVEEEVKEVETAKTVEAYSGPKSNFKEALISIQNINAKELIQSSDVRDVQLAIESEILEQILSAAVNKLADRRQENKKIVVSNQVHTDKTVISLFLAGSTFNVSELEFLNSSSNSMTDGADMNLIILKEMVSEANATWHCENKADRNGNITGMNIRFTINRVPKESKSKNLVSVIRGKKKDIQKEMMN